ncbi:MAG TPA: hypothetical protein RMH85_31280 [Polyangiaceae bacterium LLY-WYZ-15_(1-7)]|nr:hypothetical protein [Sandaracinus sp.]HJL05157.1 hypothetical protein [Polyangiaceae bacterium LLY-WYZ-15_(1-7)]HJL13008.1 hypothetical protein [Polyangiaceae bacterium LLY-WYZ-15_(1-7)]
MRPRPTDAPRPPASASPKPRERAPRERAAREADPRGPGARGSRRRPGEGRSRFAALLDRVPPERSGAGATGRAKGAALPGDLAPLAERLAALGERGGRRGARPEDTPPPEATRRRPTGGEPLRDDAPPAEALARFELPPPVTLPPPGGAAPTGSARERAEAAALAERVLTSLRVGTVRGQREVRLRLGRGWEGVEVRLRLEGGEVVPELHGEDRARAAALAARLDAALAARGVRARPATCA